MVPARAGMSDGISWKTCSRQNCWCGFHPTGIIKTLGFFYPSFNCKQIFFPIGQTFMRNFCWGCPAQESLLCMERKQGHLVRAQDGDLGGHLGLLEPSHFGWGFSKAAYPALWRSGRPKALHFLHLWRSSGSSLEQSSPSELALSHPELLSPSPCMEHPQPVPTWSRRAPLLTKHLLGDLLYSGCLSFYCAVIQGAPKWQRKEVRRLMAAFAEKWGVSSQGCGVSVPHCCSVRTVCSKGVAAPDMGRKLAVKSPISSVLSLKTALLKKSCQLLQHLLSHVTFWSQYPWILPREQTGSHVGLSKPGFPLFHFQGRILIFALKSSSVSLPPSELWVSHWKRREELNMARKEQSDGQVSTQMLI